MRKTLPWGISILTAVVVISIGLIKIGGNPMNMVLKDYYADGKLKEKTPIINGRKNGMGEIYYESGKLKAEIPYKDNGINGLVKEYYEDGKVASETNYINGCPGKTKLYDENGYELNQHYENGKLVYVESMVNGKKNGVEKHYFENGTINMEIPYTNDTINGIVKEYYENGVLKTETNYKNGEKQTTINYDKTGKEIRE